MIYTAIVLQVFAGMGMVFSALAYTQQERQLGFLAALLFGALAIWFAYRAGVAG